MQLDADAATKEASSDEEDEEDDAECFLEEEELSHLLIKDAPARRQDLLSTQCAAVGGLGRARSSVSDALYSVTSLL